jgi:hypothetical protein
MIVNNMESVFKIFFRGMTISRVKSARDTKEKEIKNKDEYSNIE